MTKSKICTDCSIKKPLKEFYRRTNYSKTDTIYYKGHCKDCSYKRSIDWKKKNRAKFNAYQNKYHKAHYASLTQKQKDRYNKDRYQQKLKNR